MCELENKLIELGAIDAPFEHLEIDDWFENVTLIFRGKEDTDNVICTFKNCYEVSLNHDENYDKGKRSDGKLNYKYFIQDIKIEKHKELFCCKISAWPLEGKILCKEISIEVESQEV